ncbi:MAG: ester cyclase [Phycisphaerae bacterium]|nr:ester cyclase [Phycisphaerae bacterium]
MSEQNKSIIRRYYEEVVSTGNVEAVEAYIAPEYTEVYEGKRYPLGIEGAKEHILGVRRTYRDLRLTVERQIAEGEWVASCIIARGIHKGEWMGIAPTGKPVAFTGVNIDRVVDGRIVEHGGAVNLLGPLLEIGAVRVVGAEEPND